MHFLTLTLLIAASMFELSSQHPLPDWSNAIQLCYKLLRISAEARERFERSYADDDPNTHCIVRCGAILRGIYDDGAGVRLEQGNAQRGSDAFEALRSAYEQCAAAIRPEDYGSDHCKKGFLHVKCYLLFSG